MLAKVTSRSGSLIANVLSDLNGRGVNLKLFILSRLSIGVETIELQRMSSMAVACLRSAV